MLPLIHYHGRLLSLSPAPLVASWMEKWRQFEIVGYWNTPRQVRGVERSAKWSGFNALGSVPCFFFMLWFFFPLHGRFVFHPCAKVRHVASYAAYALTMCTCCWVAQIALSHAGTFKGCRWRCWCGHASHRFVSLVWAMHQISYSRNISLLLFANLDLYVLVASGPSRH